MMDERTREHRQHSWVLVPERQLRVYGWWQQDVNRDHSEPNSTHKTEIDERRCGWRVKPTGNRSPLVGHSVQPQCRCDHHSYNRKRKHSCPEPRAPGHRREAGLHIDGRSNQWSTYNNENEGTEDELGINLPPLLVLGSVRYRSGSCAQRCTLFVI